LFPAVNRPSEPIVPPPLTDQTTAGCGDMETPNWSTTVAEKSCVALIFTVAETGVILIEFGVWLTVTVT
jgi:hypothetical protein